MSDESSAPVPRSRTRAGRRNNSGLVDWLREIAIILISALLLSWFVKTLLLQAFFVPSDSMNDTLVLHDRFLVNKLVPDVFDLHRGDIVVFEDPGGWLNPALLPPSSDDPVSEGLRFVGLLPDDSGHLVKRLIGLPGDHVACAGPGSPLTVNGVAVDETLYLKPGAQPSEIAFDVVVPADHVWVMGDNRQQSADSRYHQGESSGGAVSVDQVVGVAFVTVWPLDRFSWHTNPESVFAGVPDPS